MDRIKNCEETFKKLFGGAPTADEGNDPEFMRILQRFIFGEVCHTGSLDDRTRELITLTVLTVNQTLPQLKAHVGACLHIGVTPVDIRETVYQCAPFIGFPKTLNAIAAMDEVFAEKGIAMPLASGETVTEETRCAEGLQIQQPIYGDEIAERYKWLPTPFDQAVPRYLTAFGFGDFSTRKGLCARERELFTVVLLAALGGAETQVRSHVAGALKTGSTREEVVCALVHAMPYMGMPRLFNALNCAKDLLEAPRA